MSPLLFALVDAGLVGRVEVALRDSLNPALDRFAASEAQVAFNDTAATWNWWRSLWPLGGRA
ncbi:hypothetical protein [Myxococcus xanthus]|uniref:hypothetical protein n=1 Tax=Myxococcus xanthus TaxID=34 RepID=UPI001126820B|nr:hypothetical protein [Myxococcus xanthus]QDE83287.1 hypothetical protein BHS07_17955 [Myxococcus xanthus]